MQRRNNLFILPPFFQIEDRNDATGIPQVGLTANRILPPCLEVLAERSWGFSPMPGMSGFWRYA
jgi:hypothetical protein